MSSPTSHTITAGLVSLDVGLGSDKAAVIRALAERVVREGRATDSEALFSDAWAREQKDETGLPGGIAIPHAKSAAVTQPSLAFARLAPGVDFGAADGPADLVFLIAAPAAAATINEVITTACEDRISAASANKEVGLIIARETVVAHCADEVFDRN